MKSWYFTRNNEIIVKISDFNISANKVQLASGETMYIAPEILGIISNNIMI